MTHDMLSPRAFENKKTLPVGKLLVIAAFAGLGLSFPIAFAYKRLALLLSLPVKSLEELYIASFWALTGGILLCVVKSVGINPEEALKLFAASRLKTIKLTLKYFSAYFAAVLLALAALSAFVIISGKTGVYAPGSSIGFSGGGMDGDISYLNSVVLASPYRTFFYFISICFLAPIVEEVFYRRLLFVGLRKRLTFAPSLILSSLIFGAMHSSLVLASILGLYLGYVYEKEKNIFLNIGLHSLINLFTSGVMILLWRLKDLPILK